MTSPAHMTGPWHSRWNENDQRSEIYSLEHDLIIACVYDPSDEWLDDYTEWDDDKMQDVRESVQANVNLIAAAPELLAVVLQYLKADTPLKRAAAHKDAHAALDKAEGR